jgi:signal transduction histidine kinase
MADELRKNGVTLVAELDAGLPSIAFDRVQLQQVLVNLMRNAVEAMELVNGPRTMTVRARTSGDMVAVQVSDSGVGIQTPEKIFEPFFTTKESGMGMGLAVSRSIVESHGGRLWAESNNDKGTTFVFTLPVKAKDEE